MVDAETAFTLFCGIAPMSTGVKNPSHSIRAVVENSPRSHRTNAGYSRDFAQGMWVEATEFRQDFPHVPATNVITMQKKKMVLTCTISELRKQMELYLVLRHAKVALMLCPGNLELQLKSCRGRFPKS